MFSTVFHELRNSTWNSTCLAEILDQDPPIFFFFFFKQIFIFPLFHGSLASREWDKTHDAFLYISLYFFPLGTSVTLLSISTNGYRACLISWLPLSHLELSLAMECRSCCTYSRRGISRVLFIYLFFLFHHANEITSSRG